MNELISLANLFNKKIFRIPDYQRGYAWTEPQLVDFWDDLNNLSLDRYHYTGMLSLKKLTKEVYKDWLEDKWIIETKGFEAYHVVDGQQRLTTFIIMLNCIIGLAQNNGYDCINGDDIEDIKAQYIVEYKKPERILKAYKFGYEVDNPSFKYLRHKILGEDASGALQETFYTLNLQQAKDFFDIKLQELFDKKGFEAVEAIFMKLTTKLQFNIHDIDSDFDVFVAFETMNNRGKRLSNLEILKNRLIYLTTIFPDDRLGQSEREQMRRDINEAWKEIYYELGRNKKNPLNDDDFLRNHWYLYFKYSRVTGDDYIIHLLNKVFTPKAVYGETVELKLNSLAEDQEYIPSDMITVIDADDGILNPIEITDYVKNLQKVAPYWYYSFNPEDSDFTREEKTWINKLNRVGISYFRPLVVAALIRTDVSPEERVALFKTIERFIFLCFRMARYQSTYLSQDAYKYSRALLKGTTTIAEVTDYFESKFQSNISEATGNFENNIARYFKNYEGFYSWSELKYVFFEYEAELAKGKAIEKMNDWSYFTKSEKDKVSIEHIFPQKPVHWYWRNQFRNYADVSERYYLTNSLGNLLALSQSVNSSLQNDEFALKKHPKNKSRCGYSNGSYSEMQVAELDDWTPQAVLDRGLKLLSWMEQRWCFHFKSEEQKIDILGLRFMLDERESLPELQPEDYTKRDAHFSQSEKGAIRVSEYLDGRNYEIIALHDSILDSLRKKSLDIYETATKNYIAIRHINGSVLYEAHIHAKQLVVYTLPPIHTESIIGEKLPDTYTWTKNYKIVVKPTDDIEACVKIIVDAYHQL